MTDILQQERAFVEAPRDRSEFRSSEYTLYALENKLNGEEDVDGDDSTKDDVVEV